MQGGWLLRTLRARVAAVVASSLALILVLGVGGWAFSQRTAARPLAAISPRPSPSLSTPSPAPSDSPSPTPSPPASPPAAPPPPRPASAPAHPPAAAPPAPPPPPPGPPPVTTNVPWYHQQYNLSCEESSLSMVLAFFGHPTSDQQVLDFVGVDSVHYWAGRPGGGNPFVNFVGDPNGSEVQQTGYGVYWPPIKAAATHFGAAVATAGQGIAPGAIYDAVRAGHPAVVWLTFDLKPHTRTDYQAFDGQTIPYAGPWEHAMVVTGINGNSVRVNDPDRGQYWVAFGTFEASYAVYGQMAVIFAGGVATPAPTPTPTPVPTPTPTPMPTPTPTPVPTATSTP